MRRTRHRRRFHTDRIVAKRRAFIALRMGYLLDEPVGWGKLADRHPLDCGRRCFVCHGEKLIGGGSRRAREGRAWRHDWGV